MKPHPVVISMLTTLEDIIPKWKIVPTKDVIEVSFKDPVKREEVKIFIIDKQLAELQELNSSFVQTCV